MDTLSIDIWQQARRIDPTLKILPEHHAALRQRRVHPLPYSREALFSAMAAGRPVVFTGVRVPVRNEDKLGTAQAVLANLRSGVASDEKFLVRFGRDGYRRQRLPVEDIIRRWNGKRGPVNITDLHLRRSGKLCERIDCSALSDFNLLAGAREPVSLEEVLTLVVSSAGVFTDSHSDDPDGSNHCFTGKKLWLVWDTFEGMARKLDDVERRLPRGAHASFNIPAFLSVPGSRWFTIEEGQTLFLPGHLTHKVVTLEDYLGVGSFFVMLPSYWRTMLRWTERTPLWALNARPGERLMLVNKITDRVTRKVRSLAGRSADERARWGLHYLIATIQRWQQTHGKPGMATLDPASARLARTVLHFCVE